MHVCADTVAHPAATHAALLLYDVHDEAAPGPAHAYWAASVEGWVSLSTQCCAASAARCMGLRSSGANCHPASSDRLCCNRCSFHGESFTPLCHTCDLYVTHKRLSILTLCHTLYRNSFSHTDQLPSARTENKWRVQAQQASGEWRQVLTKPATR